MTSSLRERPALQRREATLAQLLLDAHTAAVQAVELDRLLADLNRRLESADYAAVDQQRLDGVRQSIAAIGYDAPHHEQVRSRVNELLPFEREKSSLETAAHLVDGERAALARLQGSIAAWTRDVQGDARASRYPAPRAGRPSSRVCRSAPGGDQGGQRAGA